ncbi:ABC transporter permease [Streptomyces longwoodensis]|uniref:ABC transporter permease n=1 Tax=Streptomyces longwoodensis TaxID=68231 RepID=UPI0033DC699E
MPRALASAKTRVGLALLALFVLMALAGPAIAPYDPSAHVAVGLRPPSADHWFGTTQTGQDVFSQILVGTRGVLLVGFLSALVSTVLGALVGITAGYLGGVLDECLSMLVNVFLVLPGGPLLIIVASLLPDTGYVVIALVLGLTGWAWGARVLRAQTLSLRRRDYVVAARAVGEPTWRIIVFEILPNLSAVIASGFVGSVVYGVTSLITLSFIGVIDVSQWNWGSVLFWAQSHQALAQGAWWWFVPAGVCIALLGTALALVNFGLDELSNPRLRAQHTLLVRRRGRSSRRDAHRARMRVGFTAVLPVAPAPAAAPGPGTDVELTAADFAPLAPGTPDRPPAGTPVPAPAAALTKENA